MRTTKIQIKDIVGITQLELSGKSVELTGANGVGKSSVLDAIRIALRNSAERDYIIRSGESEGQIYIETDVGLSIDRRLRKDRADFLAIKEGNRKITSPQSFLNEIFTPLQLNPFEFTRMSRQEKNRIVLDLIQFDWSLDWIRKQFGELPNVNYEQNILQILNDIQSENGEYYKRRQEINSRELHIRKTIEDIAKEIPENYQSAKWETYNLSEKYKELQTIKDANNKIERAIAFKNGYNDKMRGLEAKRDISISAEERAIAYEREQLKSLIERLKAEIVAANDKLSILDSKLEDKKALAQAEYDKEVARLDGDIQIANEYANKEVVDTTELQEEIKVAEDMKLHLNEYKRMLRTQEEREELIRLSRELTRKIELARELPGEILKTATIPIKGLSVKDGIPLLNGLPINNLSDGEQLQLCVDVAISKPSGLQIILIDGTENLSSENRNLLYEKCKEKGLQFIATRTTDENELIVTEL